MSKGEIRKLPDAFLVRAQKTKQDCTEELAAFREMLLRKYGTFRDSTEDIRHDRETRG
jgi:hypothetical protein